MRYCDQLNIDEGMFHVEERNDMRIGGFESLLFCVTMESSVTRAIGRNIERKFKNFIQIWFRCSSCNVTTYLDVADYQRMRGASSGCRVCLVLWLCIQASVGPPSLEHRSNSLDPQTIDFSQYSPSKIYSVRSAKSISQLYSSCDMAPEERSLQS